MIARRTLLQGAGAVAAGAALAPMVAATSATAAPYRALVVLLLDGGCDGHNVLVPTDGAYADYQRTRTNLALAKSSLVALPGSSAGHTFGLHPALAPLAGLYAQRRLAFIANAGPLVVPATGRQVLDGAVPVPPFLLGHAEQVAVQLGWLATPDNDSSGWGGRLLEMLPSGLRHARAGMTMPMGRTSLVRGRRTPPSFLQSVFYSGGGGVDPAIQELRAFGRMQFGNAYQTDYSRRLAQMLDDDAAAADVFARSQPPSVAFPSGTLGEQLASIARTMPVFKSLGYRRQIFLVSWGSFDTHAEQRGPGAMTQDTQLAQLAPAIAAFDQAVVAAGLDADVTTLALSDFGRSLRPGSGGGSEHAWGNHWFAFGGAVAGGQVHGTFPSLVLGGPDDADFDRGGRFVPTTATDQVAATLALWLGLSPALLHEVFPHLANFERKTIALLNA